MGQNYHNMALPTTLQLQTPYPSTPSCYPSPRTIIPETERERGERRENNRGREKEKGSSNSLTAVFPLTCTGSQEVHSPREGKLADIKLMGMQMVTINNYLLLVAALPLLRLASSSMSFFSSLLSLFGISTCTRTN